MTGASRAFIERAAKSARGEIERRHRLYRRGRARIDIAGKTVVLVDDGSGDAFFKQATEFNFACVIPMAQRLSAAGPKAPILFRLDSGFDSARLTCAIEACNRPGLPQVDFLVKWNPRTTDVAGLATRLDADGATHWEHPRAGKRVTTWEQPVAIEGIKRPVRRVLRLIERAIDAGGQALIEPRLTLEGWTTSLPTAQMRSSPQRNDARTRRHPCRPMFIQYPRIANRACGTPDVARTRQFDRN